MKRTALFVVFVLVFTGYAFGSNSTECQEWPETKTIHFEDMEVRFNDGAFCAVSGVFLVTLQSQEMLAEFFKKQGYKPAESIEDLEARFIIPCVHISLRSTAIQMSEEESYTTKNAEFCSTAEEQLEKNLKGVGIKLSEFGIIRKVYSYHQPTGEEQTPVKRSTDYQPTSTSADIGLALSSLFIIILALGYVVTRMLGRSDKSQK